MRKETLSDYTEAEFLQLLHDIHEVNVCSEEEHSALVRHFEIISEHPDGADLIYYPASGHGSPDEVLEQIKQWRVETKLAGFRQPRSNQS
ncbi:bacteriocin immunity protein [Pseudomonas sp. JZ134]|uniref:bacteriocin immunity protein n=1 Tax=Pseudomonas sp. JZ134 TaxID=2806615 RepID=UPI003DA171D3